MAPTPEWKNAVDEQELIDAADVIRRPLRGDEVVISGMSGVFPQSESVQEFMENLYNKVDMVSEENPRWLTNHPEVPVHLGKVGHLDKFDAQFFKVHFKQAVTMAPMCRKMLEHAYGAIFDAGVNSKELHGKKVGVFIGFSFSEYEKILIFETVQRYGLGITGCSKTMYANRISYWIDGKGPSFGVDVGCATSYACLEQAYRNIKTGHCEAAIVGACNLCMLPCISLSLKRLGFLCSDGKTKSFDQSADGYVRADTISVVLLQKAKDARRVYSEIYHAKGNYTLKDNDQFQPFRDPEVIEDLLNDFYSEIDVLPKDVEYVEAHGTGIGDADKSELEGVGRIFCEDNQKPLLIGSVKSNMGHSEAASGLCALTKVCLAYHKGTIPANLHCTQPRTDVKYLQDGRMQVVTEHARFNRGFTAMNNFSFTGANYHVLMKGHYKPKNLDQYKAQIPYLILASGRNESSVKRIINYLKSRPLDAEQIGLIHNIYKRSITGHMCRGFAILDTNENNETTVVHENTEYYPDVVNPVWFVYSGMGSQWTGMGKELMRIPTYAKSIHACHKVLEPKGIDLIRVLTEPDDAIYGNILNCFIGIAAMQIGITDVLREIGIVPDNVIGHSVGEIGCAYADGCFNLEEMMLCSYYRGLVSTQTQFIKGAMAAVGIGFKAIQPMLPPNIEVACHNSSESCTISGPADDVAEFVQLLKDRGIFAKAVSSSNIAYHSKYVAEAGPNFYKYLAGVIKAPKMRSKKWLSTSVPQVRWNEPLATLCSAEYHTNNLLSPVLFEETAKLIPSNALVIEIAPHGLLQAILKRSLPTCIHVPLTRRDTPDPIKMFFQSIGKLFEQGLNPDVQKLYPKIDMPVSTETPLLSHLVEWEHSEDWPEAKFVNRDRVKSTTNQIIVSIHDDEYKYVAHHVKEGKIMYPESALLVLVWETFAMWKGLTSYRDMSIRFNDVKFSGEIVVKDDESLKLAVMIHKGNQHFEITYENVCIMEGSLYEYVDDKTTLNLQEPEGDTTLTVTSEDVYKMFNLRGYSYGELFQNIQSTNLELNRAHINWTTEWVTFLDALIQFADLGRDYEGVSTPKCIQSLTINVEEMKLYDASLYEATKYEIHDVIICRGVKLHGIEFKNNPNVAIKPDVLHKTDFVSYFPKGVVDTKTALLINLQIVAENISSNVVRVMELQSENKGDSLNGLLKDVSLYIPTVNLDIDRASIKDYDENSGSINDIFKSDVIILDNIMYEKMLGYLHNRLSKHTFVLLRALPSARTALNMKLFNVVSAMGTTDGNFVLLKKVHDLGDVTYLPVNHDFKFSWIPRVQSELKKSERLVLVSQKQSYCGLYGFVQKLRNTYGERISLLLINDPNAPNFDEHSPLYREQLNKGLTLNVLKMGNWGGYYLSPSSAFAKFQHVTLVSAVTGDLDSLTWTEVPTVMSSKHTLQVHYAGISTRDVQTAVGVIPSSNEIYNKSYGMEFSGVDNNGQRVMGLLPHGAISSIVEADPELLWPVPEHWTLEDAATVPLAYSLAFYCLTIREDVEPGMSVLVQGGSGALGQAVISLALALNCNIYTTVSNIHKKAFLLKLFPELDESRVSNSREESFENAVMTGTKGKGCYIIINCSNGKLREITMRCRGNCGSFLDVSNVDMNEQRNFKMGYLSLSGQNAYVSVQLSSIFKPEHVADKRALQVMIAEGIAKGYVRPLSRIVYSTNEVTAACRLVAASRHRGRVLIRVQESGKSVEKLSAYPRMNYTSEGTYIVITDKHELGVELVDSFIQRGARHVIINSTPSCFGGYLQIKMRQWAKQGAEVTLSSEGLQSEDACVNFLHGASEAGPVRGIFVSHVASEGRSFQNTSREDFVRMFDERALVVAKLDGVSKVICPELKHFVVILNDVTDEVSAFMNSLCENICQMRTEVGLPALVVKAGMLSKFNRDPSKLAPHNAATVLKAMEIGLTLKYNNIGSFNIDKRKGYDLIGKISDVIGCPILGSLPLHLSLNNLGADYNNIKEIKNIMLRNCFRMYSDEKIKNLTIEELKAIQTNITNTSYKKETTGLQTLFTYIEPDEYLATDPMVPMNTRLTNVVKMDDEFDTKATYLMLIPGFDGLHQIFQPICERLKILAMTMQLGPEYPEETVEETALRIFNFVNTRFDMKEKFYILGYSYGVLVALELAAILEAQGNVGTVFCLDSSPDVLQAQLNAVIGELNDEELQNAVVKHMFQLMTSKPREFDQLNDELPSIKSWPDKIDACTQRLKNYVYYSNQYKKAIIDVAYKRIKKAFLYKPSFKALRSQLILLRGKNSLQLPLDYNLSKYSQRPVRVHHLECDHASAPYDLRCSNIVNQELDDALLKKFNETHTCENYYADLFKVL